MSKHPGHTDPRTNRYLVVTWPLLAVFLCAALWIATVLRADAETARAETQARKDASAYAEAYEQVITRSVGQMDQVTMQLKFSWEHGRDPSLLDELRRDGMFTDSAFSAVAIVDRAGIVRAATRPALVGSDLSTGPWFVQHRNHISTALRIGAAPPRLVPDGDGAGQVLFTRRLDTADDEFDGVVLMAVDARYLTSFVSPATLGAGGVVALAGTEGRLRAEQRSDGAAFVEGGRAVLPLRASLWLSERGVRKVEGPEGFADGQARVLGWRHSDAYPLVALVALSHGAALEAAAASWVDGRDRAIAISTCLLLLGGAGAMLARRAVLREREQGEVQRAYRTATESGNDGFYMAAAVRGRDGAIEDFRIVDCNERGAFFYGLTRATLVGSSLSRIDSGLFGDALLETYRKAMETGFHEDDRKMPSDNRLNISWGRRRLVRVGNGLAVTLQDISERKAHESQLERLANEDVLTGLATRHAFLDAMPALLAQARAGESGLALLFIDLDEFKHVNDSHGHAVGDALLKNAAQRLLSLLRPTDRVARFGGDEFLALLHPVEGERQAASVAARIVEAFAVPFLIGDDLHAVGASIGISMFPRDGQDAETLVRHSDIAMYAGKNEGKGQYRFFDPALSNTLNSRARLKQSMLEAIERDQFTLFYQPRVDVHSGELLSMEALIRWQHPELGIVSPAEFIPLAESTGIIVRIGEVVIDQACAQLAAWRDAGLRLVPVSINVSPKQFLRGGVQRQLSAALHRHRVPASLIEVEITESAMMGDHDEILAELAALRALGVKLHVDDFGTGYSSLSQLQRLKMDVLKVDRAFTSELGNSKEGKVFFQAIVSMAHALGMSVVAEGVETGEQLDILRGLDCNEVQGYYIARPVPAAGMQDMMQRRFLLGAPQVASAENSA
ncbi:bifunctional diguanylate cyclase/phosphodiesterase [Massilia yuzhufengensis]|uniref:Diguanylate cyclase (GGDEF) domain-containing protein n=1 Tax=Massilia yuzhufengensis TaxID=1164594 RepID=A0A1I1TRK8_9BURK|nr:EAL domain-containing protein [Massilia yuzhufengensis]SFD61144.1 diguanylate cyclase (GGDEF) domain-containing protein [Massilia yuzhufengensis]